MAKSDNIKKWFQKHKGIVMVVASFVLSTVVPNIIMWDQMPTVSTINSWWTVYGGIVVNVLFVPGFLNILNKWETKHIDLKKFFKFFLIVFRIIWIIMAVGTAIRLCMAS
ncbi:MAG: hypothetical protein RR292_07300 [Christensenellaceae bacterium]